MIQLTKDRLKKLQNIELEMLLEVDRICKKNHIHYSLDGGTLLGAVRHGGFIPWDDDADVVMTRAEYDRFAQACKRDLDKKRFFLQDFETDPEYRWGYAKLRRNETLCVRPGHAHTRWHHGICIDIFIYDNVPDHQFFREVFTMMCFLIRKGLYSEMGRVSEEAFLLRVWYTLLSKIPRQIWIKWLTVLYKLSNRKKTKLARHMTFPYPRECHYGLPRRCFDHYIKMLFEGHSFLVFRDYDWYLRARYGEYWYLPPVEARVSMPISILQFPEEKD